MKFSVENPPSKSAFLQNLEEKMLDAEFLGDTKALLRPNIAYSHEKAYEQIKSFIEQFF